MVFVNLRMIEALIDELAYDKINIAQALTRAKILSFKIANKIFQEWLKSELEGYENIEGLPTYRKIYCIPVATIADRLGRTKTIPINLKDWDEQRQLLSTCDITSSIPTLEENYIKIRNCYYGFPSKFDTEITR